jgi:hypothetical protein
MQQELINVFIESLVKNVRDRAIASCDIQLYTSNMNSPIAARWNRIKKEETINEFAEMLISDVVDDVLFSFLDAIDNGILEIIVKINDKQINLSEDGLGELGGSYMGEWRSEFTKERCFNDLYN